MTNKPATHYKSTAMREDGVLCGKKGVPFSGELHLVTCRACTRKAAGSTVAAVKASR